MVFIRVPRGCEGSMGQLCRISCPEAMTSDAYILTVGDRVPRASNILILCCFSSRSLVSLKQIGTIPIGLTCLQQTKGATQRQAAIAANRRLNRTAQRNKLGRQLLSLPSFSGNFEST